MIWLTWRQFRPQAWVTAACLAAFGTLLAISGTRLTHLYGAADHQGVRDRDLPAGVEPERHPDPVAGRQDRPARRGRRDRHRAAQPAAQLVVDTD